MCRDEEILALEEEMLLLQKRVGPIVDYKESITKARDNTTEAMENFVHHLAQGSKINDSIDETIGQASRELEATRRSAAEIGVSVQSAHEEVRGVPICMHDNSQSIIQSGEIERQLKELEDKEHE